MIEIDPESLNISHKYDREVDSQRSLFTRITSSLESL